MNNATLKHYRLYDLDVVSGMDLPELERCEPALQPDPENRVTVELGEVPEALPGSIKSEDNWYEVTGDEMICTVPTIGRIYVSKGRHITIAPDLAAAMNDIRAYLFGVGFAAVVHQRGLLPLHISAVRTPYGVWAFTGDSGAGKSTLVGLLQKMTGWPLLCDDVAVVRMVDGVPVISAGLQRLKLWDDAVAMLGADQSKLVRDMERENKFHLKAPEMFDTRSAPLKALVQLERGDELALHKIAGARLFQTVMNAIYRPYFVPLFGQAVEATKIGSAVSKKIEGRVFERPWPSADQAATAQYLIDRIKG